MIFSNKAKNKLMEEKLAELTLATQERDAQTLAQRLNIEYRNLTAVAPQTQALVLIDKEDAMSAMCAPFALNGKVVGLACKNPSLESTREIIKRLKDSGYSPIIFAVSLPSLNQMWKGYSLIIGQKEKITGQIEVEFDEVSNFQNELSDLKKLKEAIANFKSPYASRLLELVLAGSLSIDASDIHFESEEKMARLRYRIDGALYDIALVEPKNFRAIASRIKLLAGMKINIGAQAQDGRFTIKTNDTPIEIRVSIIPSAYGETVVMRVLNPKSIALGLDDLGFRDDDREIINREISRPNGIILNTGPTGSGKTTTLYAFLKKIYQSEIKVITVEDPIEYHLTGITQTQINRDKNYTFANGLRSILRQDPDVILIGEIRDQETAEIAMQAALTGHLVLSTLHTNEAAGAIPRLLELKVETGILGSAVNLIIAQRLTRKLCSFCKKDLELDEARATKIKEIINNLPNRVKKPELKDKIQIFKATEGGCVKCNFTGYKGRVAIVELLVVDSEIQQSISRQTDMTITELRQLAEKQGMVSMVGDGILKIVAGITSIEEVENILGKIF